MNFMSKLGIIAGIGLVVAIGCDKPKVIAPAREGDRNDNCEAKNDCKSGLSCINSRCQPIEFDLLPSGKECIRHECEDTKDCCGDKPSDPPAKCAGLESICNQPYVPGCTPSLYCTEDEECGEGSCSKSSSRTCAITLGTCTSDTNCFDEVCELVQYGTDPEYYYVGTCSISNASCEEDEDCTYFGDVCGDPVEAETGSCDCTNPDYEPSDEICSDPDCEEVCGLVCENNLCVEDDSCEEDEECPSFAPICDDGECVECTEDEECDEENDEECRDNVCERPCEFDQECPTMNECQSGECIYVGCKTKTDCVLLYADSGVDARLAECVERSGIGDCVFPCENDSHCGATEVCADGYCQYIGCENDAQCDNLFGLHGQDVTEDRPYVTQGLCVAPEGPGSSEDEDE